MTPRIAILPLGPHIFAAFIDHGCRTSYHQVVLASNFLAKVGLAAADEEVVVHEALAFLCRAHSEAKLPAVLELIALFRVDPLLLPELRARLA